MLLQEEQNTKRRRLGDSVRRALRALSTILIVSGAMLIADAGLTLVWQEPISAVYAKLQQRQLAGKLNDLENLTQLQLKALDRLRSEKRREAFLARLLRRRSHTGDPIGRIKIKRLGINFVVVEGTKADDLRKGPGHYGDTPFPGIHGTVAIAGHRTTYLAPFRKLNKMHKGDLIKLEMPYGEYTYKVQRKPEIVNPDAVEYVTGRKRYDRLALTACHPLYSAKQRIVVFAKLLRVKARGAARITPTL
jgi:sortase A